MDNLMGLTMGDNFYASRKTGTTTPKADEFNLYYQQSFNKMLSDITSDSNSMDSMGGNDNSSGSDMAFLQPQMPTQLSQELAKLKSGTPAAPVSNSGLDLSALSSLSGSTALSNVEGYLKLSAFSALIGKTVEYQQLQVTSKGIVTRVVMNNGQPYMEVDSKKLSLEDIISVS